MFTFAFVTGVKRGWLDAATYGPAARRAWIGLVDISTPTATSRTFARAPANGSFPRRRRGILPRSPAAERYRIPDLRSAARPRADPLDGGGAGPAQLVIAPAGPPWAQELPLGGIMRRQVCLLLPVALMATPVVAQQLGTKVMGGLGIDAGTQGPLGLFVLDRALQFTADKARGRDGAVVPIQGLDILAR